MNFQHPSLAAGGWQKLSFVTQMAHIGSEVERALRWREKNHEEFAQQAFWRSLELFDLTLQNHKHYPLLREVARARELWADFFIGENQYRSTAESWQKYFYAFNFAARK